MASTISEIRTFVRGIILEDSGSGVFSDSFLDSLINMKYREVLASKLSYIAEDFTASDTSIKVFGAVPKSGQIIVGGDYITFTGVTAGTEYHTLTGCLGAEIDHSAGEPFSIGYKNSSRLYPQPVPVDMDSSNDCIFLDNWGRDVLGYLAAGQALLNTDGPQNQIVNNLRTGEQNLATFLTKYNPDIYFNA